MKYLQFRLKINFISKNILKLTFAVFFIIAIQNIFQLQAQSICSPFLSHESGFYTSIYKVIDKGGDIFTITLRIEHDGCADPECKPLNQYSVQAEEGTYSDISYERIVGDVSLNGINLGPNLGSWPHTGFRISSINGIGDGQAGVFYITYTLSGGVQDQICMAKAGDLELEVTFYEADFLAVLGCPVQPYYLPPDGGKIHPNSKIGSELTALANFTGTPVSDDIFQIIGTNVLIEVTPVPGIYQSLLDTLSFNYGFTNQIPDPVTIIGQFPIANLLALNNLAELESARPLYPVNTNIGLVISQGDSSMVSDIARKIFRVDDGRSINGSSIKIGVLSNSYNTKGKAADDVDKFDLPGHTNHPYNQTPVEVIKEFPYGEVSDEGRAMMHIIHDIAPGAELAFRTGVLGAADMAVGIEELAAAGCNIIVDDITYITEPFFEDGIIAQTVDNVVDNGVAYFTSAGNFGAQSYQSIFSYSDISIPGTNGKAHRFGTNADGTDDIYQQITVKPGKYTFVLQWDDNGSSFPETNTDLDIYITNGEGMGMLGYNKVNNGENPIEVLPFFVSVTTTTNLVIVNVTNTDPVNFKYIIFRGDTLLEEVEYTDGTSTIVGHANSEGAMTVGAIRYDNTPAFGNDLEIMSFSSVGGTVINGDLRNKPDFTAPNGVNTNVDLGSPDFDLDGYPNFFGTSAAAPHAAAVAALLLDAKMSYYSSTLTPGEIRTTLSTTALGYDGYHDEIYGFGFIQADAALMNFANPRPIITGLAIDPPDAIPGLDTFTLTVTGDYFLDETEIYFNGIKLNYIEGTKQVTIYPFNDLYPPIQAWNPSFSGSNGSDGGMSDPVYFTEKPTIAGIIENPIKSYGESLPEDGYTATYYVHYIDGSLVSLEDAGLPEEQYYRIVGDPNNSNVPGIPILTNANALANAGLWPIYADYNDPLNPIYTGDSIDPNSLEAAMLNNFNFSFEDGILTITKLDLTITPNDTTITYGEPIGSFNYTFYFDDTYISPENKDTILDSLYLAYAGDLAEIVGMVDPATIEEGYGDLTNTSYFVSANAYNEMLINATGQALALVNGQALALVNGQALALVNGQALALVNGQALALVNANLLVNGQALALVNANTTTNGQALALVNTEVFPNGQALALVNSGALQNGQALALVNGQALALVNGQALALVNGTTVNDINNNEAIIILTANDITTVTTDSPDKVELISMTLITGNTAGTHNIAPGAFIASNFEVAYGLGELTIDPVEVEVISNHQVINEGQEEPDFTFTYNGFVNGDSETSVFGPDGPAYYTEYDGQPDIYPVFFPASSDNYNFTLFDLTLQPGVNLYVNPDANGTKSVKPKLRCVDETGNSDPNLAYIAYFEYENGNNDHVFVFTGINNELTIESGGYWEANTPQPQLFEPGGSNGTAWEVLFDGTKITWTVTSQHHGHPSGTGSNASSTSSRCIKSSALFDDDNNNGTIARKLKAYPNPSGNVLYIDLSSKSITEKDIAVYNIYGIQFDPWISKLSDYKIEISLVGMSPGVYFIKVRKVSEEEVLKIIKY